MSQKYHEGNFFSIPLGHGHFGLGLIARQPRRGAVLLGYFFGPQRTQAQLTEGVESLGPRDAAMICRFKDSGLHRGAWRVMALDRPWQREQWPIPPFVRLEGLSGRGIRVEYADDNLLVPVRETAASITDMRLAEDVVLDERRVVELLAKALQSSGPPVVDPTQWTG